MLFYIPDGQEGLACCDSWGRKELDTTERLNWTDMDDITLIPSSFFFTHKVTYILN